MRRRLILLAGKSFVVTLPKKWAKSLRLKKGDEVEVTERGSAVLIESAPTTKGASVKVNLEGLNASLIWHALISAYINGASEIEASFKDQSVNDPRSNQKVKTELAIEKASDLMVGMEITRRSKNSISIKEISTSDADEYEQLMRRVWLTVLGMAEEASQALSSKDMDSFRNALRMEKNVNKLILYAQRLLRRGAAISVRQALAQARMLTSLESMADALASLEKYSSDPLKHLKNSIAFLRSAYEAWFDPSNEAMDAMYQELTKSRSMTGAPLMVASHDAIAEAVAGRWTMK